MSRYFLLCSLFILSFAIEEGTPESALSIRFASPESDAAFVGSIPISLEIDGPTVLDKEGLQLCVGLLFHQSPDESVSFSAESDSLRCEQNLSHGDEASMEWRSLPILRFKGVDVGSHVVCAKLMHS